MKNLIALVLLFGSAVAVASAEGVAREELMALESGPNSNKPAPTLSSVFRLVTPQGETVSLQETNAGLMVRPASTMKLFTGWMALQKASRADAFLSEMLHTSDNAMAQATLKSMGGAKAMTQYYSELGFPMEQLRIVDGSGLSKSNRTSCEVQLKLLDHIRQTPDFERFRKLLASPGEEGTLDDRLLELQGRLFGKTGTLSTTIALTGYVESVKGTVMFCVVSEFFGTSWPAQRARIDRIVLEKVRELEAQEAI